MPMNSVQGLPSQAANLNEPAWYSPAEKVADAQSFGQLRIAYAQAEAQAKLGAGGFAATQKLAETNNAAQLAQLMAALGGEQQLAGINNVAQLGLAQGGWQNQLANTGLQNTGQQQLAGVNNAAQLGQLLAQITGQKDIAGLNNANTLANTGLQNQGQMSLAGVNNASQLQQLMASIGGQKDLASINNASQLGIAQGGWKTQLANTGLQNQGQLANIGLQNQGDLQLAGANNASQLQQIMAQISGQTNIARLTNANSLKLAGINTAPELQRLALDRQKYEGNQSLLQQILGASDGGIGGLLGAGTGSNSVNIGGSPKGGDFSSGYLGQLMAGVDDQFTAMPQDLFQSQLNQILGNAGSALGGQLRSAQGAAGGAGMGSGSPVAQALMGQYGNASNAATQNSLTNAFLGKYNTDFQRQQAQAGYKTSIGQLGLGQTQSNREYGLGLGNLQLGALQNSTTRRGQTLGLLSGLVA